MVEHGARVGSASSTKSASTQAESLEGRPLAMYNSLMLPDRSRLRLLELGPGLNERHEHRATREPEKKGWPLTS